MTVNPEFNQPIVEQPPIGFLLADWMMQKDIPGGWRLWRELIRIGYLNKVARYRISGPCRDTDIYVPLGRMESSKSKSTVAEYEEDLVRVLAEASNAQRSPVLAIDCGADIGMVSTGLIRSISNLDELVAFEPNNDAYSFLAGTLNANQVNARALNLGVGDRAARGELASPDFSDDAHSMFVQEQTDGSIEIVPVDEVVECKGRFVVLKIDVEGNERGVIVGAQKLLSDSTGFAVSFEANKTVCASLGQEPNDILKDLSKFRNIWAVVAEIPEMTVDPDRPFFEQVSDFPLPEGRPVYNIVAITE
ncbi:MAG: FkbM family methyltransferase [Pseudomonadota bacterium]